MVKKDIDKWSLWYQFFRPYQVLAFRTFYRRFQVHYANKKIEKGKANIIAVNHQNALMDALAVLNAIRPFQPVFLARADIFKKPAQAKFLNSIKILPIFRMRDGAESLKKNEEIFQATLDILKKKRNPLALMPEGRHGDRERLRPLVKGIFRIAFMAQEDYKEKEGVKITPACLNLSHYTNVKSDILLNIGKPIEINEYWKEYEENPVHTTNKLRERLSQEMKNLMIHIESEEYYQLYQRLRRIYQKQIKERLDIKGCKLIHDFRADKHLIATLDLCLQENEQQLKTLNGLVDEYWGKLHDINFRDWIVEKSKFSFVLLMLESLMQIVFLPAHLIGFIGNYVPYFIIKKLIKKIKDSQFRSSVAVGLSIILFPIWYFILLIPGLIISPVNWIAAIAILFGIPLLGNFTLGNYIKLLKLRAKWKYKFMSIFNKKKVSELHSLRDGVIACTDEIANNYLPKVKFDWLP